MLETINENLKSNFYSNLAIQELLLENKKAILNNEKSPFLAADDLLKMYFEGKNIE